jgi:hypothetical protein
VALIGQPSPDDVYQLATDLLARNSELRALEQKSRMETQYYRTRLMAELRKRKTA